MTPSSLNTPGTLVMYKLREERIWWPAILYSSHTAAQPFMTKETYKSDNYVEMLQQFLQEILPDHPRKPVVCVLRHPNKPQEKEWWCQVDDAEQAKPLSVLNLPKYVEATPEPFKASLRRTLTEEVVRKLSAKEVRTAWNSPAEDALPNVSPITDRNASISVQDSRHVIATGNSTVFSNAPSSRTLLRINEPSVTPANKAPLENKRVDTPVNKALFENKRVSTPINKAHLENERVNTPVNKALFGSERENSPVHEALFENERVNSLTSKAPFDLHVNFTVAWDKLEDHGWYQHRCAEDNILYYRAPPELEGRRFKRHEMEAFLRETYGWNPTDDSEADNRSVVTTPDCRTKPQDPGQPLPDSPETAGSVVNLSKLKKEGWKVVKGGQLGNFLYLRPGVKKGEGKEGVDYFTVMQDAFDSYISELEDARSYYSKPSIADAQPRRLDLDDEISQDSTSSEEKSYRRSAKKKAKQTASFQKRKSLVSISSKKGKGRLKSNDRKSNNCEKQKESIPGFDDIAPLLQIIGFEVIDQKTLGFKISESSNFIISIVGLPVFLARYGIPNDRKLKADELQTIKRWIRFVNIPNATPSQLDECKDLSCKEILSILRELKFEIFSGTIYVPSCPRSGRILGVHYFPEGSLQLEFRSFLGWSLDFASMIRNYDDETQKSLPYLRFVSELKSETPKYDHYTKLRLWAAGKDVTLPTFSTRKLDPNFIEALINPKIEEVVPVLQVRKDSNRFTDSKRQGNRLAKDPKPANEERSSKPLVMPWHQMFVRGESNSAVLEILQKLDFQHEGENYIFHPTIGNGRFTLEEIRQYMVQNHIDDFETKKKELNKSDMQTLHRWCTYINLDHSAFMPFLSKAKTLPVEKVVKILQILGFGCVSGDYYLPGADRNRLTREAFSFDQLLAYCRSREVWSINDVEEVGIHSYEKFGIELSDWVDMLLTMARVDVQILAFKTPSKLVGRSRRRRESLHAMVLEGFNDPDTIMRDIRKRSLDAKSDANKKAKRETNASGQIDSNDAKAPEAEALQREITPRAYCEDVSTEANLDEEANRYSEKYDPKADTVATQNEERTESTGTDTSKEEAVATEIQPQADREDIAIERTESTDTNTSKEETAVSESKPQVDCDDVSVNINLDMESSSYPEHDGLKMDFEKFFDTTAYLTQPDTDTDKM